MPRKPAPRPRRHIDPKALAEFQAGLRKRYTDRQILDELKACADRLGRSPTMREFAADPLTTVHPQTVSSTSAAGTRPSGTRAWFRGGFATRAELVRLLRDLGTSSAPAYGPRPRRASWLHAVEVPLLAHVRSLTNALREAGFDVPVGKNASSGRSSRASYWRSG